MSFGESFIILNAEISDTRRNVYEKIRVRTVQHPNESNTLLCARLLAYCDRYSTALEFTQGLYDEKLPTIWEKDSIGSLEQWIQVGEIDSKKLERSLKNNPRCVHSVYFVSEVEIQRFCHSLRGSKTNWIASTQFYFLNPDFIEEVSESLSARPHWQISFVDSVIYLDTGSRELSSPIETVDIWSRFQESILNNEVSTK